jgi:hypothetical protein
MHERHAAVIRATSDSVRGPEALHICMQNGTTRVQSLRFRTNQNKPMWKLAIVVLDLMRIGAA